MAILLTLHNEAARAALARAAWRALSHPVGESALDDAIWSAGSLDEDDDELADRRQAVDERLRALHHIRSQVDLVEGAPLGRITVDLDPVLLAYELKNLRDALEDGGSEIVADFLRAPEPTRTRMLAIYDAAGELMASLPEPEHRSWEDVRSSVGAA